MKWNDLDTLWGQNTRFGMSWTNVWDDPDNDKKKFERDFERKAVTQIEELVTHYGEIIISR